MGKHKNRRRRTARPAVPDKTRRAAAQAVLDRYPTNGHELLVYAKHGATGAKRIDALVRTYEWILDAQARFQNMEWPRPFTGSAFTLWHREDPPADLLDAGVLVGLARETQVKLKAILQYHRPLARVLRTPMGRAKFELLRDPQLMMAAAAEKLARCRAIPTRRNPRYPSDFILKEDDLVALAVAVGLEEVDQDQLKTETRWRKRLPAISRILKDVVCPPEGQLPSLEKIDFFGPL